MGKRPDSGVDIAIDVWEATVVAINVPQPDISVGDRVAIKCYAGRDRRRFYNNELSIHKNLEHPHIIRDLDCWESADTCCIALDYYPMDLATYLAQNTRTEDDYRHALTGIILQVAEGLTYLHTQHVIHRDLHPGNIFVDPTRPLCIAEYNIPYTVIADFDIAKQLADGEATASGGEGTAPYTAPEVLCKDRHQTSCASDVYALGMMLYKYLFDGSNDRNTLYERDCPYATLLPIWEELPYALHPEPAIRQEAHIFKERLIFVLENWEGQVDKEPFPRPQIPPPSSTLILPKIPKVLQPRYTRIVQFLVTLGVSPGVTVAINYFAGAVIALLPLLLAPRQPRAVFTPAYLLVTMGYAAFLSVWLGEYLLRNGTRYLTAAYREKLEATRVAMPSSAVQDAWIVLAILLGFVGVAAWTGIGPRIAANGAWLLWRMLGLFLCMLILTFYRQPRHVEEEEHYGDARAFAALGRLVQQTVYALLLAGILYPLLNLALDHFYPHVPPRLLLVPALVTIVLWLGRWFAEQNLPEKKPMSPPEGHR